MLRRESTATRVINDRLERATVMFDAGSGPTTIPAVMALAVNPVTIAEAHPTLRDLAADVRKAEYGAFARYRRWAEGIPYCRLSRMPGVDFALRHSGTEEHPAPPRPLPT